MKGKRYPLKKKFTASNPDEQRMGIIEKKISIIVGDVGHNRT